MQRVFSYRQGDRAEYLAQYILSAFAISVPVPRQEDVGSDFHCSLLRREGDNLRPYLPFNIQIKSYGDEVLKKGITFGGVTKAGMWRKHEIDQLCQTDTPFLIGIVNKEEQWMDVFSTITRFFVLHNWKKTEWPREVTLLPYEPEGERHLGDGSLDSLEPIANMPEKVWKLPIGQPILRITIEDSEDAKKIEEMKALLEPYLRLDQENSVFSRIGLGYFSWPLIIRTGQPLKEGGIGLVSPQFDSPKVKNQLRIMTRSVASLLRSYQVNKMKAEILEWESILNQLPIDGETDPIKNTVKEFLEYAHTSDQA